MKEFTQLKSIFIGSLIIPEQQLLSSIFICNRVK